MHRRALVVAVAAACGQPAPVAAPPPTAPPVVLGEICADGATPGVTGDALFAAGEAALVRGCPKEAIHDLLTAPRDPIDGRVAYLWLAAEAALGSSFLVGPANGRFAIEDAAPIDRWAVALLEDVPGGTLLDLMLAGVREGKLARTGQRLALLNARSLPQLFCLPTQGGGEQRNLKASQIRAQLIQLHADKYAELTDARDATGMLALEAATARGQCDLARTERVLEQLATAHEQAGRRDEAAEARLDWIEVHHFPGGRAGNLGREGVSTAEVNRRRVRDLEAAANLEGEAYRRARAADEALAKVLAAPLAPATLARATWLQAAVAYRLLGRPASALVLARRAIDVATVARRADYVDAARVVAALAAAELGRLDETRELLKAAFASIARRGALGMRRAIVAQTGNAGRDLVERGRRQEALVLAQATRDAARDLGLDDARSVAVGVPLRLNGLGRIEEALLEYERADGVLAAYPASPKRDAHRKYIADLRADLERSLGREKESGNVNPATAALARGDTAAIAAWLRSGPKIGDVIMSSEATCFAVADQMLAGGTQLLPLFEAEMRKLASDPDENYRVHTALERFGYLSLVCGAQSRKPALAEVGMKMLKLLGAADDEPAYVAHVFVANGDHAKAAETWIRYDRQQLERLDARGALETSRRAGEQLEDAALAHLHMTPQRAAEAVDLLERARARDLRAARSSRRRDARDPALAALADVEARLADAAVRARALAELDESGRALAAARREVERLTAERERVAAGLSTSDPIAYRAAAIASPPGAAALQKRLGADEAVVYYVVRPLEAWAIVIDRTTVRPIPLKAVDGDRLPHLFARLNAYRRAARAALEGRGLVRVRQAEVVSAPPVDLPALRRELYELLVRPLEAAIPPRTRVMIVPDSHTSDLAFAELGAPDAPWIARNPLRLLPGTYLLGEAPPAKGASLVVGDVAFGAGATLAGDAGEITWARLPGTRVEAIAVARGVGATAVLGREATEEEVKRRMAEASLVHLATHGNADPVRPAYSVIALATPGAGAREDGLLYAFEIERLRLRARLVVLSACETGKGISRGSEGVLALDRAFLVAGASTVLSSLWVVPDDATAALMTELYAGLSRGRAIDVALADAMNAVRANPKWADPIAWAAFRVVGTGT